MLPQLTPATSLTEGVRLTDSRFRQDLGLGDKMTITIVRADVNLGKIDGSGSACKAWRRGYMSIRHALPSDVDTGRNRSCVLSVR